MNKLKNQFGSILTREQMKHIIGGDLPVIGEMVCRLSCCAGSGADCPTDVGLAADGDGTPCSGDNDCNFPVPTWLGCTPHGFPPQWKCVSSQL